MENVTVKEGKPAAIIAYLWAIGLVIAFLMNSTKKNPFASFHIRQAIGLILIHLLIQVLDRFLGMGILTWIFDIGWLILVFLGIWSAIKGEEEPVPLLGEQFQEWFRGIG